MNNMQTYPGNGPSAPPRQTMLGNINAAIDEATSRIASLTARAEHIADGIFGPRPSVGNSVTGNGSLNGISRVGSLHGSLEGLNACITALNDQLERLSEL